MKNPLFAGLKNKKTRIVGTSSGYGFIMTIITYLFWQVLFSLGRRQR